MTTYHQTGWDLTDLFPKPDSEEIKTALIDLEQLTCEIEFFRQKLSPEFGLVDFMDVLNLLNKHKTLTKKINGYAYLLFSENTQSKTALDLMAYVKQLITEKNNRILFFELWWKKLDTPAAEKLLEGSGKYHYWLATLRQNQKHTLTEVEEKIIQLKNINGVDALNTIYDTISNSYTFHLTIQGEEKELNRGEIMNLFRDRDEKTRAAAYQEHYQKFAEDRLVLGQIYQSIVRDWHSEHIDLRHHDHPISVRNQVNDIPDEVVDTLLEVAQKNTSVFQRFFLLKAKRLGKERLHRYDIYAPVTQSGKTYSFEEASHFILDSFKQFDPKFYELAKRVLNQKHLDSETRKNKSFLPFCYNADNKGIPYINIHFEGRVNDISTTQHELGHAIHAMLANKNTAYTHDPSLPLAETASTFSEMLLIDYLLAHETDSNVRNDLLFGQMDHYYAGVQRQAFTAIFEIKAHEMIHQGASVDQIADTYLANLKEQFGESMEVSDEFRWEWVAYPHIFNWPFYVYAYSFGQLLVLALYQKYKTEGKNFIPHYIELLSAGSSASPMTLLDKAGINIRQASFWQGGYDVINDLVSRLEQT
jgi:oligoendopeptidase F